MGYIPTQEEAERLVAAAFGNGQEKFTVRATDYDGWACNVFAEMPHMTWRFKIRPCRDLDGSFWIEAGAVRGATGDQLWHIHEFRVAEFARVAEEIFKPHMKQ